jgi:hypothetical protein
LTNINWRAKLLGSGQMTQNRIIEKRFQVGKSVWSSKPETSAIENLVLLSIEAAKALQNGRGWAFRTLSPRSVGLRPSAKLCRFFVFAK